MIGKPAPIIVFNVVDVLIKGGRRVPDDARVDIYSLNGGEILPGSIYVYQPFLA